MPLYDKTMLISNSPSRGPSQMTHVNSNASLHLDGYPFTRKIVDRYNSLSMYKIFLD